MNNKALYEAILNNMPKPRRTMAPCNWYGGKGHMANKLLPLLPRGRVYVEPYCGMASLFFHKPPSPVEVLNDLNGDVVNLFRVLQNPETFKILFHRILFTPYSYAEFCRALDYDGDDPIMRAWAFYVRQNQGFNGVAKTPAYWGRTFGDAGNRARKTYTWETHFTQFVVWHERLMRVQIDQRDALEVIRYWDSPNTVFYVDPPYMANVRSKGNRNVYVHEATDDHHEELIRLLSSIQGQAMVSGYRSELYTSLETQGFARHEFATSCYAAIRGRGTTIRGEGTATREVSRTEVVWVKTRGGDTQACLF